MYKCNICGKQYDNPSFGGPGVCPACDCGYAPDGHKLDFMEVYKIEIRYKKGLVPYYEPNYWTEPTKI